ncbi:Arc family DNA-binding protein [Rhizobium sp. GN54]|uniref:Arc family DNA-binding protein n=1 Tax=Rhizobium sp. GN54 TaxID=2898150 RepID=UPI001E350AAE|nr:Arc family DNA-binding protein [Rhizobium sp. GN54]MCD2185215.1 Arc family DNA-binding protein [Rhizobium sp. GN54]
MEITDLKIRMPAQVKDWLAARADENERSMNGEILAILKTVMRRKADRRDLNPAK